MIAFTKLKNKRVENPCLKQSVQALIVSAGGQEVYGANKISNQVLSCPRVEKGCATGEGYHLCESVCGQKFHAEVDALNNAKKNKIDLAGATLYLINHYYCCDNCLSHMKKAKISKVIIFSEIGETLKEYNL